MFPSRSAIPRRRHARALVILAILVASLPSAVSAAQSPMTVSVTAYPNNAEPTAVPPLPAFVTAGEYAAFDVTIGNPAASSTVTSVSVVGTTNMPAAFVDFVVMNDVAGQVDCEWLTSSGTLSCALGNFPAGRSVSIRVIFDTPNTAGQSLMFSILGSSSGASTNDTPGQSRGDQFEDADSILLVPLFLNSTTERGAAEYIPVGTSAEIRTAGTTTSATNQALTILTIPAIGATTAPYGTYGFLKEWADLTSFPCPSGAVCHGQAVQLTLLEGQPHPSAFKVELRLDNVKADVATPKKWDIYHVLDTDGPDADTLRDVEMPFATTCAFGTDGIPTNAPCGVSRVAAGDDKNDYIAVFWLTENGYIRGG